MISGAANKAIWCPVSSLLVFELLALDFSRMSGVFVETIWKHKDLLQVMEEGSPWEYLHLFTLTQMLFPGLVPHQCQVAMLFSVIFFSYLSSRLKFKQIPGRFHCSPHSCLLLYRESSSPFCSTSLGYPSSKQLPPTPLETNSIHCQYYPVLLWKRKQQCWL